MIAIAGVIITDIAQIGVNIQVVVFAYVYGMGVFSVPVVMRVRAMIVMLQMIVHREENHRQHAQQCQDAYHLVPGGGVNSRKVHLFDVGV